MTSEGNPLLALANAYVEARLLDDVSVVARLLSADCQTQINSRTVSRAETAELNAWLKERFLSRLDCHDVMVLSGKIVVRWHVSVWNRRTLTDPSNQPPDDVGLSIEVLEVTDGRISARWMAYNTAYLWTQAGW